MLGYFPLPYPDELFHSMLARYASTMDYASPGRVNRELFDNEMCYPVIDLPGHVGRLVEVLPYGQRRSLTADYLIDNHTLLPYYSPFLAPHVVANIRREMVGRGRAHRMANGHPYRTSVIKGTPILEWLRFCPVCREADRQEYGETYWHRTHQLPLVLVCPQHDVWLAHSRARARKRAGERAYVSAEATSYDTQARPVDRSHPDVSTLLAMAKYCAELLRHLYPPSEVESLRTRYLQPLEKCGFVSVSGNIEGKVLVKAMEERYSPGLLRSLTCELGASWFADNWLQRLLRKRREQSALHPKYHLLLMHFMGYSVREFFDLPITAPITRQTGFGDGPWPCVNVTCEHYGQRVLTSYQVLARKHTNMSSEVGLFACECGFIYTRVAPGEQGPGPGPGPGSGSGPGTEQCSTGQYAEFKVRSVLAYGSIWESALERLCSDPDVTLLEAGRRLNATSPTVKGHAARLGLEFKVGKHTLLPAPARRTRHLGSSEPSTIAQVAQRREALMSAMRTTCPGASRGTIKEAAGKDYDWLLRHDREWLEAQVPPQRRVEPYKGKDTVYWKEYDLRCAGEVRAVAQALRSAPGRPEWVTVTGILRHVEGSTRLRTRLAKLPFTNEVLSEVTETWDEFSVRCVRWAAALYALEGIKPGLCQLAASARVSHSAEQQATRQALEAALRSL